MKTFLFLKLGHILQKIGANDTVAFIFFTLGFSLIAIYGIFLLINIIGLLLLKTKQNSSQYTPSISVIVAIRDGGQSLPRLINSFLSQSYSGDVEFILVDDDSTDDTKAIIKEAEIKDPRFKYISSKDGSAQLKYKKRALDAGIKNSNNSILLFTDVDCIVEPGWVDSMARSFDNETDYIVGFSRSKFKYGFANLFQRIDFLILMFSAVATTYIKYPLASSGQNQAYRRDLFNKVGGYNKIYKLLMGDDSIFLQLCLKENINVKFCMNHQSFVYCRPEKTWKSLLLQRIRWAADGKIMWKYNFLFFLIMASTVFVNLLILVLIFIDLKYLLLVLLIKFILEGLIAYLGSIKFHEKISIISFVYWFFLNV